MVVYVLPLVFLLAMTGHSSAIYCICRDGVSDSVLQRNIDYACGAGADCAPIIQNGACFNPNTVRDHCNYAVNSYYQRRGQALGSCDFTGTAAVSQNPPTTQNSACVYPSSPSTTPTPGAPTTPTPPGTPTTPTTPGAPTTPTPGVPTTPTPPSTGIPTAPSPPSTGTPTTPSPPSTGTPTTPTPFTGTPSLTPGPITTAPPTFGLAPSVDNGVTVTLPHSTNLFCSFILTLLLSGLMHLRV